MNEKLPRGRLLNEVLQNDSYQEFDEQLKQQALTQFRRGRLVRRLASISMLAATVMALILAGFFVRLTVVRNEVSREPGEHALISEPQGTPVSETTSKTIPTLTDEELIASFPPNSCFLAEVDGRTILVFHDSNLRKQYLH